jgi:transposase-like protein
MSKNKIQFQQGLSLPKFFNSYGKEKQCEKTLYSMRWPQGLICSDCGGSNHYELKTRKLFQCSACKRQISLIAGTIFEAIKLQLTTWFLAIYLITQSKDGISSLNLARTLGISANAALRMKHKLQHVMKLCDDGQAFSKFVQIDAPTLAGSAKVILPHKSGVTVKPLFYCPTIPAHIEQVIYGHSLNAFSDDYSRLQCS